jgi:hypothetical protein
MVCGAGAVEFGMPLLCSGFLWRPTDKSAGYGRIARPIRREKWRVPRYIGSSNGRLGLIKPVGRSRGAHAFLALAVYARWETFQYTTAGMSRSGPTDRDSWRGSQPVARVSLSVGASGLLGLFGCGRGGGQSVATGFFCRDIRFSVELAPESFPTRLNGSPGG